MYMQAHHLKVVEHLEELFQDDPRYLALLVGGSLVKGWGSVNSDVDILLVVTYALSLSQVADAGRRGRTREARRLPHPGGNVTERELLPMPRLSGIASIPSETGRSQIHGGSVSCTIANGPGAVGRRHWQIGKTNSPQEGTFV